MELQQRKGKPAVRRGRTASTDSLSSDLQPSRYRNRIRRSYHSDTSKAMERRVDQRRLVSAKH